jgi:hypothetical protein
MPLDGKKLEHGEVHRYRARTAVRAKDASKRNSVALKTWAGHSIQVEAI